MAKPEIRLKGFEGEWVKSILGDLFKERVESDIHGEMLSVTMNKGIILASENGLYDNSNSDKSHYKLVKIGDIAYNSMRMWQGASGCSYFEGIVSPAYTVLKPNEGIYSPFFAILFKNNNIINTFRLHSQGLTSDTWNLKYPAFSKIAVYYPLPQEEQTAISVYFKSLDSMIQATTKKIESLKQMKQACLVSMFPQAGETTPRVRFKGFEGEWVKDKAVNLFMTFNERNRPDLPVLSANQDIRGMAPRSDTGYTISHNKANEVTYKVVKPGQYVIHLRSFQGGFAHSAVEGITSPAYTVFGFKNLNLHDDYFWKIIFMSKSFIKSLETITYGIRDGRSISFSEFSEMSFLFPSKQEQQKISTYFRSLDKQISLQEQKLEKLKQIKAACLDKMFV